MANLNIRVDDTLKKKQRLYLMILDSACLLQLRFFLNR